MEHPVAIIGGGFAGLAAATALVEQGVPVRVFEARPRLGGRAATHRDPRTGEAIDNGQHLLAGCYTETLAMLSRIGARSRLHWPSTLRVEMIDRTGRRTALSLPPLPAPLNLLAGVLAWDALAMRDRWSSVRAGWRLRDPAGVRPGDTVRDLLTRSGQSPRMCELLWEPLALAALNQSIDRASAQAFVAVTSRMFGTAPDAAALLRPAVPLDELYVVPAQKLIERAGSSVVTHANARVIVEDNRVAGVQVGEVFQPATVAIVAVPWFAFADVFDPLPEALASVAANAAALGSAPIVTVNLWMDGEPPRDAMIGLPGRTFQWVFARSHDVGPRMTHLSLVSSGAEAICDLPNDDVIRLAIDEVCGALAELGPLHVRHASVVRERRATFSLAPGGPPRPGTTTPVGGLLLAGDWIDTGLPATIESAVVSGHRAAALARLLAGGRGTSPR